jgi:hypothetical protein
MPDDYDFKMNDLQYKKYKLRQTFEGINNEFLNGDNVGSNTNSHGKGGIDYQDYCPGAR